MFRFARTIGTNETKLSIDCFVKMDSFTVNQPKVTAVSILNYETKRVLD